MGGCCSGGSAINNAGQVTGRSYTATDAAIHAFLYSNGQMTDLGTFGGRSSSGSGINDAGQVTGSSETSIGSSHAFLYNNGQMMDLGTLGGCCSSGSATNNEGQVTGSSATSSGDTHAFLYSNGQMTDLNDLIDPSLGITLTEATGINDHGQIVANGGLDAYLLTPIPEPSTTALSCGGNANGSIGLTQVAQYTLAGQAGGSITLTLANSGSANTPQALLLDPSGKAVLRFSASESPQSVTLGSTGTYRILVFGGATAYSLGLQCNSGMNGEGFVPLPPCRIADTRVGSGFSDPFWRPQPDCPLEAHVPHPIKFLRYSQHGSSLFTECHGRATRAPHLLKYLAHRRGPAAGLHAEFV